MKLLLNLWRFLNSIFLQLLLLAVAFKSYNIANNFGHNEPDGYGGAIAMGLITCVCIFGIVWLQVNKSKQ